ncbi:hypothetical protein [Nocardioides houyundeii]|uniref:hypothetical protein n=1 Tax=Nocardioides houyundeii TaxID=2045452 RepID=UPI000DF19751|nr:hypothetical protein [Nocardioides houyundeii]
MGLSANVTRPRAATASGAGLVVACVLLLAGCQGQATDGAAPSADPSTPPTPVATGAPTGEECLLTSERLAAITGVPQGAIEPRWVPETLVSRESLVCELASVDERGVGIEWHLQERPDGSAPTARELTADARMPGAEVVPTTLEDGTEAWLSQGGTGPQPALAVVAAVDDTAVRVYAATLPSTRAPVPRQRLTEEALATVAALVSALRSG